MEVLNEQNVMIKVFKTNVEDSQNVVEILQVLTDLLKPIRINFDLEDCDRILRIEGTEFHPDEVANVLNLCGFECELLL